MAKGGALFRIHDLERLLKLCQKLSSDFKKIQNETSYLTLFYIPTRYPGDFSIFSYEEAKQALLKAKKIKNMVLAKLGL